MDKPYFSLFGPAIRSYYYEDAYRSISENCDVPFEFVFVGNSSPLKRMPDNFRYIYSEASPAQCWEIAARESRADLLISTADDLRYSKNFLNNAIKYVNLFDLNSTLISFRYGFKWGEYNTGVNVDEGGFFDLNIQSSSAIGASGIFRKDLWTGLGGLDRRFYGSFADIDLTMRLYTELGMSVFIPSDCIMIELPPTVDESKRCLLKRSNPRSLLNSFWVKDGVVSKYRLSPVEVFE